MPDIYQRDREICSTFVGDTRKLELEVSLESPRRTRLDGPVNSNK